jgi:hypothetical protein
MRLLLLSHNQTSLTPLSALSENQSGVNDNRAAIVLTSSVASVAYDVGRWAAQGGKSACKLNLPVLCGWLRLADC